MTDNATPAEADETQELLLRIQGGDPQAFDELFARHRAEVHRAGGAAARAVAAVADGSVGRGPGGAARGRRSG